MGVNAGRQWPIGALIRDPTAPPGTAEPSLAPKSTATSGRGSQPETENSPTGPSSECGELTQKIWDRVGALERCGGSRRDKEAVGTPRPNMQHVPGV